VNAIQIATARIEREEGYRQFIYRDALGHQTIGYGVNLDAGIDAEFADAMVLFLSSRLDRKLSAYSWYTALNDARKAVFIDVAYNLGLEGLLHFTHCIAFTAALDWANAAQALLDSDAARLNVARYEGLAQLLLKGA
jgi:lysozyme